MNLIVNIKQVEKCKFKYDKLLVEICHSESIDLFHSLVTQVSILYLLDSSTILQAVSKVRIYAIIVYSIFRCPLII